MAGNTENVKLGVCKVIYKGVNLGLTKGGVEVDVSTQTHPVTVDQYGESPINEYIMKRDIKVTLPLAETTIMNLAQTMPGTTITSNGTRASGSITLVANPIADDTITINGTIFTFKSSAATQSGPTDVLIGATAAATAANLLTALQHSIQDGVTVATYALDAVSSNKINITHTAYAASGNTFSLVKTWATAANCTLSASTLLGGVDSTKMRADVTNAVGTSLLSLAGPLILHPIANADSNTSEDLIIPKAATPGSMKFAYKYNEERIFNTEFSGYPGTIVNGKDVLFQLGDLVVPG